MPVLATWQRSPAEATKAEKMEWICTGLSRLLFVLWRFTFLFVGIPMGNKPMRCKDQEEATEVEEKPEVTEVVEAGPALL